MIVVCKKNTKRIVKGIRYEAMSLNNPTGHGYVYIKDIGRFSVNNFTDTNGNNLPHSSFNNFPQIIHDDTDFSTLNKGDILICKYDRYKAIIKDKMYKISDLKSVTIDVKGWQGVISQRTTNSIKLDGNNRWLKFNSWQFRKPNTNENRELGLNTLLGDEEISFTVDSSVRRIDIIDNKDNELIKLLSSAIVDKSRHRLSVIDWACQKTGIRFGIQPSDFDKFLEMPLKDILSLVKQD